MNRLAKNEQLLYLVGMSLYEFIALAEHEQAEVTWQGEFCMTRDDLTHTIALYKVHQFYVEVFYNNATNEIERLNPFIAKKRLTLYFHFQQN